MDEIDRWKEKSMLKQFISTENLYSHRIFFLEAMIHDDYTLPLTPVFILSMMAKKKKVKIQLILKNRKPSSVKYASKSRAHAHTPLMVKL